MVPWFCRVVVSLNSHSSHTMTKSILVFITLGTFLLTCLAAYSSASGCRDHFLPQNNHQFQQKTNRFYQFQEQSNSWAEVELPYDLVTCVNGNCKTIGSINRAGGITGERQGQSYDVPEQRGNLKAKDGDDGGLKENYQMLLPLRKRVSLSKISDTSIWVTGESGSIYERFWNGVQWVIVPHDLPDSAGRAISIFTVNHTIFALSEAGHLHQMRLAENSQPIWVEYTDRLDQQTGEAEHSFSPEIKSAVVSHDGQRIYFCTKNGSLLELDEVEPPRWVNHGQPPGANVAAIADATTVKPEVVFIVSSAGDLYEYRKNSKPPWKKHIWKEESAQDTLLIPSKGCSLQGLSGPYSMSLFLIAKTGQLVERRLHQRKWKWMIHGSPEGHLITSITQILPDELKDSSYSLLLTTETGYIFEYQMLKQAGTAQEQRISVTWINHMHPLHAKAARGIAGLQFQAGRILFSLDDGRLAELHLSGLGGESSGPAQQVTTRRKVSLKYVWSILDAPESEGWNAEYCTVERGPFNCIAGIKEEVMDIGSTWTVARRRKSQAQALSYLMPDASINSVDKSLEDCQSKNTSVERNFHLRILQKGRSFFLITNGGQTFEYLHNDNFGIWLQHEHPTSMNSAVGAYNGSLFLVDVNGSLLIRERSGSDLGWINCTAIRKGKQITGGAPWDEVAGRVTKSMTEDALFFVSKSGRLMQFTVVALRKFKWKDAKHPPNTKIASIVDKEGFRDNIVFVVGRNGRLYQYNKLTGLWHEHYQSQHLLLSQLPGTAMRASAMSLKGSLFMISEDGGLVEYNWNTVDGWTWVEHGTPYGGLHFIGGPGPSFEGNQLFLIGSDGNIYLRYFDRTEWKWRNYSFPYPENIPIQEQRQIQTEDVKEGICVNQNFAFSSEDEEHFESDMSRNCDCKVASTRPIPFADDSVIFELRDGRLAEMRRINDFDWVWSRIIATPTSLCPSNYWMAMAS
ncbi:hypothetical protein Ancab_024654 [Ancistrocladus abbreviatus]